MAPLEVGHTNVDIAVRSDNYFQALSINPINAHFLELLNLALEASAEAGPLTRFGGSGRGEEWEGQMRAHVTRESQQLKVMKTKEKEKEAESSSRAMFGDMQEGEPGMALG